jgi:hypothetical protein
MNPREWPGRIWSRVRRPSRKGLIVMAAAVFLAVVSTAAASTFLFTNTIPGTSAPTAGLTTGCSSTDLMQNDIVSGSVVGNGSVIFGCGSDAAFSVAASGSYTPAVSGLAAAHYADIWITADGTLTSQGCKTLTPDANITNGAEVSLSEGTAYFYCLDFYVAPGAALGSLTVTWSSP